MEKADTLRDSYPASMNEFPQALSAVALKNVVVQGDYRLLDVI